MIDNPAGMWMEILIAYHVCISEWVNSWLCLAPYLCRSAVPKNALLCAVFPKRERCMCTEVIRYSFLKWNTCVLLASEFESETKIHFEISFFYSLHLYLDDVNFFSVASWEKSARTYFSCGTCYMKSVCLFFPPPPPKEYFEKKEKNVSRWKNLLRSIAFL